MSLIISYIWTDAAGNHKIKKEFEAIEDAVQFTQDMKRNPLVKKLDYEMVKQEKVKPEIKF